MQKVISLMISGVFVLGLALSVSAQQSQQSGTAQTGSQQQPGMTGSQQQTSGTTGTQQQREESINFTITKIEKDAGKVSLRTAQGTRLEVNFPEAESAEAKRFMQNLQEGKTLTVQVGAPGTMRTGSATGTGGATQQQQGAKQQETKQQQAKQQETKGAEDYQVTSTYYRSASEHAKALYGAASKDRINKDIAKEHGEAIGRDLEAAQRHYNKAQEQLSEQEKSAVQASTEAIQQSQQQAQEHYQALKQEVGKDNPDPEKIKQHSAGMYQELAKSEAAQRKMQAQRGMTEAREPVAFLYMVRTVYIPVSQQQEVKGEAGHQAASIYNEDASEHAKALYNAALDNQIAKEIVKEHVEAIGRDLKAAQQHYTQAQEQFSEQEKIATKTSTEAIKQSYQKTQEHYQALKQEAEKDTPDPEKIRKHSAGLYEELGKAETEHRNIRAQRGVQELKEPASM